MRSIFIIFILCLFTGCAKKKPELVIDAIDQALTYLSASNCSKAIAVLEEVGRQNDNAIYLQVLASAYACASGFDELAFLETDVALIDTSPSTDLMKSLTLLSLSDETEVDSDDYENIWTAIGILLESDGGAQPSQLNRDVVYTVRKSGDMGVQALILTIVQLGKFLNYYGNVDAAGAKGLGTASNTCFIDYTYANAQAVVAALPVANNCNSNVDGSTDIVLATADGKRRACEGLMLMTNLIDILENIDLSDSGELADLEDVATAATAYKTTAITADPSLATLLNITSTDLCVAALASASEVNNMQLIYALIFESGLP